MIILGLTGGIGTGKSTAANILRQQGIPVHSADATVHRLLDRGGAGVKPVAKAFPEALKGNKIDRAKLGKLVLSNSRKLKILESILHPLVRKDEQLFLAASKKNKKPLAILEIPLLFETGAEKRCDFVVCMKATRALQRKRVLQRIGMTEAKLRSILNHQMPEKEKWLRADYVVLSDRGLGNTKKQLLKILNFINPARY